MEYKKHFDIFLDQVIKNLPQKESAEKLAEFQNYLEKKMDRGYHEHGDQVFEQQLEKILAELSFEATDLVGWGLVAKAIAHRDNLSPEIEQEIIDIATEGLKNWLRLQNLKEKLT